MAEKVSKRETRAEKAPETEKTKVFQEFTAEEYHEHFHPVATYLTKVAEKGNEEK